MKTNSLCKDEKEDIQINRYKVWNIGKKGFFLTKEYETIFIFWDEIKDLEEVLNRVKEVSNGK